MKSIIINYEGKEYELPYKRDDIENVVIVDVTVNDEEIKAITSGSFRISLHMRDSILSYPVHGIIDQQIKGLVLSEIFTAEGLDLML